MPREQLDGALLDALWEIRNGLVAARRAGTKESYLRRQMREAIFFIWEIRLTDNKYEKCERRFISRNAESVAHKERRYDHAIPVNFLTRKLINTDVDKNEFNRIISDGLVVGIITKEEDQRLTRMGFRSKMPDGWSPTLGPFARYDRAEIEFGPDASEFRSTLVAALKKQVVLAS